MPKILAACTAPLALLAALVPVCSQAQEFKNGYTVSYYGMHLARFDVTSVIEGDRFKISGDVASAGFASLFDSTTGTVETAGRVVDGHMEPDRYALSYSAGAKQKSTTIKFEGNRVSKTTNVPPPKKKKRKDWVPVGKDDLNDVSDPLSASVFKASSSNEVCRRTLRVYDGEMRADLHLSDASSEEWSGRPAVTCHVRFEPVAGYRKNKKALIYLRDNGEITITFAQLAQTGFYAPVVASIGTQVGTVRVFADPIRPTD